MTQLQPSPIDYLAQAQQRSRERVDAYIHSIRASNPVSQADLDRRDRPRLTVQQINRLNESGIRAGLSPANEGDTRSPATRFLDLIDLPRNTTANILFGEAPGTGEVAGAAGLTSLVGGGLGFLVGGPVGAAVGAGVGASLSLGANAAAAAARPFVMTDAQRSEIVRQAGRGTLGQPSVYFSDALRSAGVENKIVRGVVGFTGDVLLDPMTYLSGGGNTVKWVGSSGARAVIAKPASKMIDDIARHVAATGRLPADPSYRPFTHLFETTVKIGDQVIDVGGAGPGFRARLMEAASKIQQMPNPQDFKGQRRVIADLLRNDIIESARLKVIDPRLHEKSGLARDFLRRYGAASDYQVTLPLSGWLSNRLRGPLQGRSLDIPVGRFGESGRLQRALGASESDLLARAYNAADLSERFEKLKSARAASESAIVAKGAAEAESEAAKQAVNRSEALADARIEAAERELERATKEVELTGKALEEVIDQPTFDFLDPMDDAMRRMARGDAATAAAGPSATLRKIKFFGAKAWQDAENARSAAVREREAAHRIMVKERQAASSRIRQLSPSSDMDAKAAMSAKGANLADTKAELRQARQAIDDAIQGRTKVKTVEHDVPRAPENVARESKTAVEYSYRITKQGERVAEAAMEGRTITENAGKINKVDVTFENPLDRIAWMATAPVRRSNTVAVQARREAMEYLQRVYGVSRGAVRSMGSKLRSTVQTMIEEGRRGVTAGASAGAEAGGRVLNVPTSPQAIRRARMTTARITTKKGRLRTRNLGLIRDIPRDIQSRLRLLDRSIAATELQEARLARESQTLDDALDTLQRTDDVWQASEIASNRVIQEMTEKQRLIEESTPYRFMQRVITMENEVRRLLGFGRRGMAEMARLRQEYEHLAPYNRDRMMREYRADIDRVLREIPGADPKDVNNAVQIVIDNLAQKQSGIRGFAPDDIILQAKRDLQATEQGAALLNHPAILEFGGRYVDQMSQHLTTEQRLGVLPNFDPKTAYFPGSLTDRMRQAVYEYAARTGTQLRRVATSGLTDALPFTYRKVTNRMFYGPPKNQKFIYVGELQRITPGDTSHPFEAWRQQHLRERPALMGPGDRFDIGLAGGDPAGERWLPDDIYPTSAAHLNANRSDFFRRVSDEMTGDLFNEDMMTRIAARTLQHEHAMAWVRFRDTVTKFAEPITPDEAGLLPRGLGGKITKNGVEYRQMNASVIRDAKIRIPIPDEDLRNFFPVAFAEAVEDYAKAFKDSGSVEKLMGPIDWLQSRWKMTTLFHPSWFVTNIIGGAFSSFAVAKTDPLRWVKHASEGMGLIAEIHGLKKFSKAADAKPFLLGNQQMTRGEAKELMVRLGIANGGRAANEILSTIRVGMPEGGLSLAAVKTRGWAGKFVGHWFEANAATDDLWRYITFADRVEAGDGIEAAREAMVKAHFDYGDLTTFERKVGTRVWPFYRFMRNNIALQAKLFLERPMIAASFPKLKNAVEQQFDAEQTVPEEMRPRWMRDNIAVQISDRPEAKFALLSIFTPIQELIEIGQAALGGDGLVETLKYATSSASPLVKAPFELGMGEELFTGREIGDPRMGKVSHWRYLAEQFRPFREFAGYQRLAEQDADPVAFVLRSVVGGRIQSTQDETLLNRKAWESGETTRTLRRQINRAIEKGDEDEAQRLAVRTVEIYRELWDLGAYDSVPGGLKSIFAAGDRARMKQ